MQATPYSQWARQFLDLWQKQMGAVMNDREFIRSMMNMMQATGEQTARAGADAGRDASHAAVSPDAVLERLDQLDYRLNLLEKRLAALERAAAPAKKRAGGAATRAGRAGAAKPAKPVKRR